MQPLSQNAEQEGIAHIYLVTYFWQMSRAQGVFEKCGLKVTPALMGLYQKAQFHTLNFYSSNAGVERTRFIGSEALGMIWCRLKL